MDRDGTRNRNCPCWRGTAETKPTDLGPSYSVRGFYIGLAQCFAKLIRIPVYLTQIGRREQESITKGIPEETNRAYRIILDILCRFRNYYVHFRPVLNNRCKLSILPPRHSVCIINSANDTWIFFFPYPRCLAVTQNDFLRSVSREVAAETYVHYVEHMKSHTLTALSVHNACSLTQAGKLTQVILIHKLPLLLNKNIFLITFMFHKSSVP